MDTLSSGHKVKDGKTRAKKITKASNKSGSQMAQDGVSVRTTRASRHKETTDTGDISADVVSRPKKINKSSNSALEPVALRRSRRHH